MLTALLISYCFAVALLLVYGLNCHLMIHLFKRRAATRPEEDRRLLEEFYRRHHDEDLPVVTTQVPIYNEINVAERIIDAVAAFDYPRDKHEIQVLDDSTDETSELIARKVKELQGQGIRIEHIRRSNREGFKAGALKYGVEKAQGELLTVFDADFVPKKDFLRQAAPFFMMQPELGFVQGRWEHLNSRENLITWFQSIGIDGHFAIEQSARNWNGLFMNFNGTAGIFRKCAVLDAGNWKSDTLTEDLDLSYRLQLGGWSCRYLIDLVAPAEIPSNIQAFKSQQFRWAKGSIQTALKLLPEIWRSRHSSFKKIQAALHLTHYLVHPLMIYLALGAPLLLLLAQDLNVYLSSLLMFTLGSLIFIGFIGPSRLYWSAGNYLKRLSGRRILLSPLLIAFGCGMALNNSKAVFEALLGRKSEFIRTPKQGSQIKKHYRPVKGFLFLAELLIGLWCLFGMTAYFNSQQYVIGHFMLLYALGFLYVGSISLLYRLRGQAS